MRQAKLLYQLAQAEGKPYQPEAYFATIPPVRQSVFSTPEVARELTREIQLADATRHWVCSPKTTRVTVAKAVASGINHPTGVWPAQPTTHHPPPTTHHPQPAV